MFYTVSNKALIRMHAWKSWSGICYLYLLQRHTFAYEVQLGFSEHVYFLDEIQFMDSGILLMLSLLGKTFSRHHCKILLFFQKIGVKVSYKSSPMEAICINYQSLISWQNKTHFVSLSTAEFAQRVVIAKLKQQYSSDGISRLHKLNFLFFW